MAGPGMLQFAVKCSVALEGCISNADVLHTSVSHQSCADIKRVCG